MQSHWYQMNCMGMQVGAKFGPISSNQTSGKSYRSLQRVGLEGENSPRTVDSQWISSYWTSIDLEGPFGHQESLFSSDRHWCVELFRNKKDLSQWVCPLLSTEKEESFFLSHTHMLMDSINLQGVIFINTNGLSKELLLAILKLWSFL